MGGKESLFLITLFAAMALPGCHAKGMNAEYDRIRTSGLTGDALFTAMSDFERNNPTHFSSKVDLGGVFLLRGELDRAWDYFLRAEAVMKNAPKDTLAQENITLTYVSLARIALIQKNYEAALGYVDKALKRDANIQYRLLKGHILVGQDENTLACEIFDKEYAADAADFGALDLRSYMYLLAAARRHDECARIMEEFFTEGSYFAGLGSFISGVYESTGNTRRAILGAFLEYEYQSSYNKMNDADFMDNIDKLEESMKAQGRLENGRYAIALLRSLYLPSMPVPEPDRDYINEPFFIEDYIRIKIRIAQNTVRVADFNRLLQMESFFSSFPIYYWCVWKAVIALDPSSAQSFVRVLEKIIALDKNGVYAPAAWQEMTKIMGYNEQ